MLDSFKLDNEDLYHIDIFNVVKTLKKDIILDFGMYFPITIIFYHVNISYDIESYNNCKYGNNFKYDMEFILALKNSNKYVYYNSSENKAYFLFDIDIKNYNNITVIKNKELDRFIKINKLKNI